jgi:hypothetical protein
LSAVGIPFFASHPNFFGHSAPILADGSRIETNSFVGVAFDDDDVFLLGLQHSNARLKH